MKRTALIATAALAVAGCATEAPDRPVTLCEASSSGLLKDGAQLRLTSTFSTDGHSVGSFRDDACPQVEVALFLHFAEGRKPLDDQIRAAGGIDQPLQAYRLDVSGVFHDEYDGTPNAFFATRLNGIERIS